MSNFNLKHSEARNIAESLWGSGGTTSYATNRNGAFYFSCSGHGGFVISANALTATERKAIDQYCQAERGIRYIARNGKSTLMHAFRKRGTRIAYAYTVQCDFYIFEEDCDWSIVITQTGIRLRGRDSATDPMIKSAAETFKRWIAPRASA